MILSVRNLSIVLPAGADRPHAVEEIGFDVRAGETLCLVGESGSGKSMTAHAVMGLLPRPVIVSSGTIKLGGRSLVGLPERELQIMRGREFGMIFQEPMTSLNPLRQIG